MAWLRFDVTVRVIAGPTAGATPDAAQDTGPTYLFTGFFDHWGTKSSHIRLSD